MSWIKKEYTFLFVFVSFITLAFPELAHVQWLQWGGPNRDFSANTEQLANSWSPDAPTKLWEKELGNGHSAILVDGDYLFTMYGGEKKETVVCLDRANSDVKWEYSYPVEYQSHIPEYDGPHSTPIIIEDCIFTISIDAKVQAFNKETGERLWFRDLVKKHQVKLPQSGYAASPVAWRNLILLPGLGGSGPGVIALDTRIGKTVWAKHSFLSSHASPILITFAGLEQAIFHGMNWIYSLSPENGNVLWKLKIRSNAFDNVSFTPIWDQKREQLYVTHGFDDYGVRAIRLKASAGKITAKQIWNNRRLRVRHGNGVCLNNVIYASDGEAGLMSAIDLDDGKLLWKKRIPKANFLIADSKLLILDEDGWLHLAEPNKGDLKTQGKIELMQNNAWTVPTLIGKKLYIRDRFRIVALELP